MRRQEEHTEETLGRQKKAYSSTSGMTTGADIWQHKSSASSGTYEDNLGMTRWSGKKTLISIAEGVEDWTAGKEAKKRRQYAVCEIVNTNSASTIYACVSTVQHTADANDSRVLVAVMLVIGVMSSILNVRTFANDVRYKPYTKARVLGALKRLTRGAPESLDELYAARI